MVRVIAIALAALAAGCQSFPIQLRSDLTREELEPFVEPGDRFIVGEAFLRQAGGDVVTCAGESVTLLPAVSVVEEALDIWSNGDDVYTVNLEHANVSGSVRWTECDKNGNFAFYDLPPETYYVAVPVEWGIGKKRFGGMLVEKVSVKGGPAERVILDKDDTFYEAKPWELTSHLN